MTFLRHLLGITKLGKRKELMYCIREKTGAQNIVKEIKLPKTVATTRTEDEHRPNTKTSTAIQTERKKEHKETKEEMEGPASSGGLRNRLTCLNLHEHDDDDD
jgi:hypothetical protein